MMSSVAEDFPSGSIVTVEIETPRLSCIKRRSDGKVDFISPIPSAFDYGFVPGTLAKDGDPQDAIVFTRRTLRRFDRVRAAVVGRVVFLDAGVRDDKLLTVESPSDGIQNRELNKGEIFRLNAFFRLYARLKRILNFWRGRRGETKFQGIIVGRNNG